MTPVSPPAAKTYNLDAERVVIGALLSDPERIFDIAPKLQRDDFYDPVLGSIYQAVLGLYESQSPVDFLTVSHELRDQPKIQAIGGASYLATLVDAAPTASSAEHFANIIREHAARRQLHKVGKAIANLAEQNKNAAEIREFAEQELMSLTKRASDRDPLSLRDAAKLWYERFARLTEADSEERLNLLGIPTGIPKLDSLVLMTPGDLIVLAARPSMGKSALALGIADHVARHYQKKVLVQSLEMSRGQLLDRIVSARIGVETSRLSRAELTEDESARLGRGLDELDQEYLFIDDDPDRRLVNLRSKARRMKVTQGLDLLVIDYLQLIGVDDPELQRNKVWQISYISNNLKQLARELDCPILALSQLSREPEKRPDRRPQLSDLRQSGEIEQDADAVLMMYRDGYYDEDCDDPYHTELYVRKNRQGSTGVVHLGFDPPTMTFREKTKT